MFLFEGICYYQLMENSIGQSIKHYRQLQGLTQRELADRSGVKYTTITKIETGLIEDPSFSKVSKLSHALGIATDQLAFSFENLGQTFDLNNRRFLVININC